MRTDYKELKTGVKNRKVFITYFESINDLVNHCKTAPINTKVWAKLQSKTLSKGFTGTASYDEAVYLLLNGWTQGAEKLNTSLKIANRDTKQVQKMVYDIVGFMPSVPRYLQGVPQNMINKKPVQVKQKVVTLLKGVNYGHWIKAEQILEDSVKFLQIVQAIEAQGIRVNVDVVSWVEAQDSAEEIFMRVPIKKANERLNISKMSFPLMHSSMLRRIIFRSRETELRVTHHSFGHGYGTSVNAATYVPSLINKNEYYLPALITEEQAKNIMEVAAK